MIRRAAWAPNQHSQALQPWKQTRSSIGRSIFELRPMPLHAYTAAFSPAGMGCRPRGAARPGPGTRIPLPLSPLGGSPQQLKGSS